MDIVKRLKEDAAHHLDTAEYADGDPKNTINYRYYLNNFEAADEIELLRKERDEFREQERKMTNHAIDRMAEAVDRMAEIERLREALLLIDEHPVEQSQQWEIAVQEMKRVARAALKEKP